MLEATRLGSSDLFWYVCVVCGVVVLYVFVVLGAGFPAQFQNFSQLFYLYSMYVNTYIHI